MNICAGSLVCRAARQAVPRIGRAARSSVTGRLFRVITVAVSRAFAHSRVFGGLAGPTSLATSRRSVSVAALSRLFFWCRSAAGRMSPAHGIDPKVRALSMFAGGAWVVVAGAGMFALGAGLLVSFATSVGPRLVIPIVCMAAGALLFGLGPRFAPAVRQSALLRRGIWAVTALVEGPRGVMPSARVDPRRERAFAWKRMAGPLGMGVALALVAGALAGAGGGAEAVVVVAFVVGLCLLTLMLWRPEVMLLAAAAFPWLDWAARRALGGFGAAWDDAFLLLFLVLLVWCVVSRRRWELWTVPIMLPALLALVAALASVVLRHVPGNVGVFALRLVFQPMLFYFLGYLFPKNKRWVQWAVAIFLLAGVALALHGIYQYVTHAPIPQQWVDVREVGIGTRAYSIIENPNGLGAFLLLGTLISGALALGRGLSGLQRGAMALVCAVHLCGEAVTFSRGGWLGLLLGVLALLVLAYRQYLVPLVAAGVVGWFVMPRAMISRLTFAFSSTYVAQSLAFGRLYIWGYALRRTAAHPLLGVGLGTFGGTSAVRFRYSTLWVDNFYLQLAAEGGLLLLALFLWTLLSAARGLVQGHRSATDPYFKALGAGAFGAFVAVAAANLTASVWETLVVSVGFWFIAGLATSACFQRVEAPTAVGAP